MPIFEYQCEKCGEVTEVLEKANARTKPACPKCGERKMKKILSSFAVGNKGGSSGGSCSTGSCPTGTCPLS